MHISVPFAELVAELTKQPFAASGLVMQKLSEQLLCGNRRAWSALSVEHASSELKQGLELSKKLQQGILK